MRLFAALRSPELLASVPLKPTAFLRNRHPPLQTQQGLCLRRHQKSDAALARTLANGTSLDTAIINATQAQVNQLGEVHAQGYSSNMMIGLEQMRFVTNIVLDRIHKPANNPNSTTLSYEVDQGRYVWMDAMAFSSAVDSYNNLAGYGSVATNLTFGADLIRNEYGGVGVYAGGGYSSMTNSAQVAQSFNNGSGYAGLYGGVYLPWNLKLSGAAGFVFGSTQAARNNISIGDFTGGKATASYGTSGTYAALRISHTFMPMEKLTVTPYIGASYSQYWMGKASETGGNDFNYSVDAAQAYQAVTFMGAEFMRPLTDDPVDPLSLIGFYRLGCNWLANTNSAHTVTAYSPLYGSFNQIGANMGPVSNLIGLGLQGSAAQDVTFRLGMVGSINSYGTQYGGGGEVKWQF